MKNMEPPPPRRSVYEVVYIIIPNAKEDRFSCITYSHDAAARKCLLAHPGCTVLSTEDITPEYIYSTGITK